MIVTKGVTDNAVSSAELTSETNTFKRLLLYIGSLSGYDWDIIVYVKYIVRQKGDQKERFLKFNILYFLSIFWENFDYLGIWRRKKKI